mmetsp:Transcript_13387/g.38953  ORF Transcript_13387/g.38953 Transcript_13387/m.38953 type:complete len:209 (+) Transcript_13387:612-1238(+)
MARLLKRALQLRPGAAFRSLTIIFHPPTAHWRDAPKQTLSQTVPGSTPLKVACSPCSPKGTLTSPFSPSLRHLHRRRRRRRRRRRQYLVPLWPRQSLRQQLQCRHCHRKFLARGPLAAPPRSTRKAPLPGTCSRPSVEHPRPPRAPLHRLGLPERRYLELLRHFFQHMHHGLLVLNQGNHRACSTLKPEPTHCSATASSRNSTAASSR